MNNQKNWFLPYMRTIFVLSCVLAGLYYELFSAVVSILLLAGLLVKSRSQKICLYINDASVFACALLFCYMISCIWAADRGLAVWGIVKYMPVPLFGLCLMQMDSNGRIILLRDIPWLGSVMTVVSYILQYIPALRDAFCVSGRLAGFFQYPNTFACFLLLGIAVLFFSPEKPERNLRNLLCAALLVFGLLEAGSRTVFILAVPLFAAVLLVHRKKGITVLLGTAVLGGAAAAGIAGKLLGDFAGMGRLTEISTSASTFLGRLLYWKDAIPVIAEHPFGLGYLGYYVSQGSFQTGVYSVRWVHNDALQLMLDIGWIPAVLACIVLGKAVVSRRIIMLQKAVMLILLLHCMADFDFEFVYFYFVLLLCMDWEDMKKHMWKVPFVSSCMAGVCLSVCSLYIGIVSMMTYYGRNNWAAVLYPWNTLSNIELLTQAEELEDMKMLADRILTQNVHIAVAWDAKARIAYTEGDFASVIAYKKEAIAQARYSLEEYTDYFDLLKTGVELYREGGDRKSAKICMEEIVSIQTMLDALADQTDSLAYQIKDKPELIMPHEYKMYLEAQEADQLSY